MFKKMYKAEKISNTIRCENIANVRNVHRTAIIEAGAVIGNNVKIGAFCYIGKDVKIGEGTELKQHAVVDGYTTIGKNNVIFPFAVIGEIPQDLKFEGEKSYVKIGNNNRIREHCTIHCGTKGDKLTTKIGNDNLLMVNAHIAHDCVIGNHCILANNATLGGHARIGDYAVIGGMSAIHQKVRIGKHAMVGGMSGVASDVIPYGLAVNAERASLEGLNLIGLKRRNFSKAEINNLRKFFKEVFLSDGNLFENLEKVKGDYKNSKAARDVIEFLSSDSKRHFCAVAGKKQ
ncbi:MAG: acyl-ACP--UDP-N-acetylglucosamine O-acyltransferase [Rickettsiales bacterium]|jgi:UDP-N-acetylglucosamine acyltransferase|nr:acyl-ACP--UDP-N-acetylglucosamine O-acyltransferase [Rickettsiales bacterium]